MDPFSQCADLHGEFVVQRYIYAGTIALVFYDYLLVLDDEIQYVWKGRKSWIFYLYILYRTLLLGNQFWHAYVIARNPSDYCWTDLNVTDLFTQSISTSILLFFSDIFVMLRIYAITCKNKILTVYIAILALTRLAITFTSAGFSQIGTSIGSVLEGSAFAIVVWRTYPHIKMLKFLVLVRTLATQATIYFIAVTVVHIFTLVASSLRIVGLFEFLSYPLLGLIVPVLTLRFVILLKKSVDPEGGQEWQLRHFSTIRFASDPPSNTRDSTATDGIEMAPVDSSSMRLHSPHSSTAEIELREV